jgi:hypothetical protein
MKPGKLRWWDYLTVGVALTVAISMVASGSDVTLWVLAALGVGLTVWWAGRVLASLRRIERNQQELLERARSRGEELWR